LKRKDWRIQSFFLDSLKEPEFKKKEFQSSRYSQRILNGVSKVGLLYPLTSSKNEEVVKEIFLLL
jgi:hypothetical protein